MNIDGIDSDAAAGKFAKTKTHLEAARAPRADREGRRSSRRCSSRHREGSPHGAVETPYGKQPLGGFTGSSGRIKFSAVATVDVQ